MEIEVATTNPIAIINARNIDCPRGVSLSADPPMMQRDLSEAWNIAIFSVSASVPAAVIAGLILKIFGKDKGTTKISINRREVEYSEGEIIRIIEETKKIEER